MTTETLIISALIFAIGVILICKSRKQVRMARRILDDAESKNGELAAIVRAAERSQGMSPTQYIIQMHKFAHWTEYRVCAIYRRMLDPIAYYKVVKTFSFDPKNADDEAFAKLEAEELLEILNEK